jgi:hypothetical protein
MKFTIQTVSIHYLPPATGKSGLNERYVFFIIVFYLVYFI